MRVHPATDSPHTLTLQPGKSIYFASDFHLGAPDLASSRVREKKIVRWLESVRTTAQIIFLVGDLFDFWFEYKHVIPKGFIRLQGKLAELTDQGLSIVIFSGNHDMWMLNYFTDELGIPVYRQPQQYLINGKKFMIGHGDGLGPSDYTYKFIKKVFANRAAQWLFARIHPNAGIGLANSWSNRSRLSHKDEHVFLGDDEWLYSYCKKTETRQHHDYYIFGHRHLPLHISVGKDSYYVNLGEWLTYCTYACFDGQETRLLTFE